ncbi:MAG: glycerophosphodiester phosphodiesterase [Actinobacteria bacterium 69-20]|nr:MAG: glycerophosphodiester phosphodiesterase [Actinobacteria bacterium 69-20]
MCETRAVTFLDGPRPRAFAHRGWHTGDLAGCENSLAAFRRAVDEGFRYIETDVQVTADGVLVAFHDDVLDRATDGHGPVAELTYREIRRARIGGREPIPTLAEVLEACPGTRFNIDPKADAAVHPLLALLRDAGATDRVCVASFSDQRIEAVRQIAGSAVVTSLSQRDVTSLVLRSKAGIPARRTAAVAAQVPVRHRHVRVVTPRMIRAARRASIEVHVWTIDDPAAMNRLLDMGVDGIMTDRPDILREVLQRRGQWQ